MGKRLSKETKKNDFKIVNPVDGDVMNLPFTDDVEDDRFLTHGGEITVIASQAEITKHLKELDKAFNSFQKTFFSIGLNLYWFYSTGAYCEIDGVQYDTIVDFAKERYGIKKATTYQFINIYARFGLKDDNGMVIGLQDKFKDYNSTSLIVMSQMKDETIDKCSPSMKVKDIKLLLKSETDTSADVDNGVNSLVKDYSPSSSEKDVSDDEDEEVSNGNGFVDKTDYSKLLTLYSVSSLEDFENRLDEITDALKKILANNDGTTINISMIT
jgi:hypothetical protein